MPDRAQLIDYCHTHTLQLNLYFANDANGTRYELGIRVRSNSADERSVAGLYARDHPDLVPMSTQYGTMNLSPVTLVPSLQCFSGTEVLTHIEASVRVLLRVIADGVRCGALSGHEGADHRERYTSPR